MDARTGLWRALRCAAACALVGALLPAAPAAAGWSTPVQVDTAGGFDASVLAEGAGAFTVSYTGDSNGVPDRVSANSFRGGQWGTPFSLGAGFGDAFVADQMPVQFTRNAAGDTLAVWTRNTYGFGKRVIVAVRSAGEGWQPAEAISGYDPWTGSLRSVVDAAGRATIAWTANNPLVSNGMKIVASTREPDGDWSAPVDVLVPGNGVYSHLSGLVGDAAGNLSALVDLDSTSTTENSLQLVRRPVGEAWGSPEVVDSQSANGPWPQLVSGADGGVLVAWLDAGFPSTFLSRVRLGNGTWQAAEPFIEESQSGIPQVASDADGDALAIYTIEPGDNKPSVKTRERPWGGEWADPQVLVGPMEQGGSLAPNLTMNAAGHALVGWSAVASSSWSFGTRQRTPEGTWGAVQHVPTNSKPASFDRNQFALDPDGRGMFVYVQSDSVDTNVWASRWQEGTSGDDPGDAGTDPGDGGTGAGSSGPGGTEPGAPPQPPPTPQPVLTDTTTVGKMPKLRGLRLDKAHDAIDRAGIPYGDVDVTWSRRAPRGFNRGDVVSQSPSAGVSVVNGIGQTPKIRLSVFQGPKAKAAACRVSTLSRDLKGADFTLVEDLLAKAKCKTTWNVRIGTGDEADVSRIKGNGTRVTASVTCPRSSEDHDLFAFVREYAQGLSFGAGDWALTASQVQRNNVRLTVVQRGGYVEAGRIRGQLVKNARLLIDTSDVGGTDSRALPTGADGTTTFNVAARRPGRIDVCIIGEAGDGDVIYGATQLTVVKRSGDFDTVGGRRLKKTGPQSWESQGARNGPAVARGSQVDLFGPIVSAIQTLIRGFGGEVAQTINGPASAQTKLVTAMRSYTFGIGQFGFGKPIGGSSGLVMVGPANLVGQAGSNLVGQAGSNLVGQAGTNAIAVGGGNAIAAGGGNLVGQAGTNLVGQAGTNAIAVGGGNLLAGATDARTARVVDMGGARLLGQAGTNLIGPSGSNAIAVGGGN